jgi:hypothetical protein
VIYVMLAFLVESGLLLLAHFSGSASLSSTRVGWWFFFAFLWLVAFGLAWHFAPMGPHR